MKKTIFKTILRGLLFIGIIACSVSAFAGTRTWTGSTSTDWGTATNWSGNTLPLTGDDVTIPAAVANAPIFSTGTYTVHAVIVQSGASLTVSGGTLYVLGAYVQITGTLNQTGGTIYTDKDFKMLTGGVFNQSGSSVLRMAKNAATAPSVSFKIATGATVNQSGGTIYTRDYITSPGTFNQTGATALFQVLRHWKPGTGSKFLSTAGTVEFTGSGSKTDFAIGTRQFNNILVNAGIDPGFSRVTNSSIPISGNFTNNNTSLNVTTNATFTFNGSGNQTITSASTGTNATFGYLVIRKTGGTITQASNIVTVSNVSVYSGTYDLNTYTSNRKTSGGAFTLSSGAIMRLAGTTGGKTGSNYPTNFTTTTISSGSTIEYYGSGQTIFSSTYGSLIVSAAGTKTAGGALTIQGNFTLSTGTFVGGSYTHNLAGNWTMASGAFTNTGTTINLNGTVNQTVSSTGAFNTLITNKNSGLTYLGTDVTATTLTFTKGIISTGSYKMIIPSGGSITGAGSSTGWVFGNLQKYYSAAAGGTFEIGDGTFYTPASVSFASVTTAGSLIFSVTPSAHPTVCNTTITSKNIGRYWTLSKPASGAIVYTTATLTFNWNTADNYSSMTAASLKVANYYSSAWSLPTISGTPTTTSIVAAGVANTGDFAVGEVSSCTVSAGFSYPSPLICTNYSTVNAVLGCSASAGTFTSSPAGLSINSSTGAINPGASSAGTYTITNTVVGSCTAIAKATVKVSVNPSATISYGASSFCASGGTKAVTITGLTGGTFTSTTGLDLDYITGQIDPSSSDPGTYVVTYTIPSSTPCVDFTTTTTITITNANYANIAYDAEAYCLNGGTAVIDFDGTTGGVFSSTAGLSINSGTGAITLASSTPGTYTVTYSGAAADGCAAFNASTIIDITSSSPGTISYGTPFCSNGSVASATISGTNTGVFSSTTGLSVDEGSGDIDPAQSTAGSYTVTYDLGGCYATTPVTINTAPSATISYAGAPFCKSVSAAQSVTRTGQAGGTYSAANGLTLNSSTGAITPSTSTAGTYTVTYTVAASGGCAVYTTTTSVTIINTPSANISYAGTPFCKSLATPQGVTFSGNTGGVFSSTTGLSIDATTGAINPSLSTAGTYTVTYTISGCSSYTTTTSVTITTAASATISYAGTPFCKSIATAQSVTQIGTTGGTYSSTAGLTINASTGAITPSTSTAGIYTVTYTVAASGGCSVYTTTTSVTITATPSASISYAGTPFCKSLATAQPVTQTGTTGGTYSSTAGLTIDGTTGAITPSTSNAGTYTVTYTVAAFGGCSVYTTTTSVTITTAASATISYAGTPFCKSLATAQPVTQTGTTGGTYSSTAGLTIDGTTGAITPSTSTAGTYTVTYTVAASGGCSVYTTTTSVTITATPSATISYAGTPFCKSIATAQPVTQTGTTGGTFSSTAGLTINASTGAITPSTSTAGTYTVTYTVAAFGGCSVYTTTTLVTITAQPAATISYESSPYLSNAGTANVTLTGTTGGVFSSTDITVNSVSGGVVLANAVSGIYTVTYTVSASGGCPQFITNTSLAVVKATSWTGAVSNEFNDIANWNGPLPDVSLFVKIPTGLSVYPVISSGNVMVKDIMLESSATLTVANATLKVAGQLLGNGGIITTTNGTLEMNGSNAQTIPAGSFSENTLRNLVINNSAGVTITGNTLNLTGVLTLSNGQLTTDGHLTLKSTENGTSRVAPITTGSISGNVTVERFVPARRAWRLLTSPVSSGGSVFANWQNNGLASGTTGVDIWSPTAVADKGVIKGGSSASMRVFDEVNNAYVAVNNAKDLPLTGGTAYRVFVCGPYGSNNINSGFAATTLSATSSLLVGNQSLPLNSTTGKTLSLIGNPYASPISWAEIAKDNDNSSIIADHFWLLDATVAPFGAYKLVSNVGTAEAPDYEIIPKRGAGNISADNYIHIQSGEGIFVERVATDNVQRYLTIKEAHKSVPAAYPNIFRVNDGSVEKLNINLYKDTICVDGTLAIFANRYSKEIVSAEDAGKPSNSAENLAIARDNKPFMIEARPLIDGNDTTFLWIYGVTANTKYSFEFKPRNMELSGLEAFLEDDFLHTRTSVSLSEVTTVSFATTTDAASRNYARFRIVYRTLSILPVKYLSVKAYQQAQEVKVQWSVGTENNVQYEVERSTDGINFVKAATVVSRNNQSSASYDWTDINSVQGVNYYRIKGVSATGDYTYTQILKVLVEKKGDKGIAVYPNPVTGSAFNLQLSHLAEGDYSIQLFNNHGQVIMKRTLHHMGGNSSQAISLPNLISAGSYHLHVRNDNEEYKMLINISR